MSEIRTRDDRWLTRSTVLTRGTIPTCDNSNDVPTVYFDIALAYGVMGGIVQIELGARILIPTAGDTVDARLYPAINCAAEPPLPCTFAPRSMHR